MTKRTVWLIAAIMTWGMIGLHAQTTVGSWTSIPTFGTTYTEVVETPSRTFALAEGCLMSVSDTETNVYTSVNNLSDYDISLIRYNYNKGYLLIAYSNGNIDLLYDNDRIVNMPDIKDASLSASHEIVDVDFGGDNIAVATKFGIVVFNDERHEVVESGIYNQEVKNAFILGDRLMLYTGNKLYISPLAARHPQLESFDKVLNGASHAGMWDNIARISDDSFIRIASTPANTIYMYTISPENTLSAKLLAQEVTGKTFSHYSDGVAVVDAASQYLVDAEGNVRKVTIADAVKGTASFSGGKPESVWITGTKGLAHFDLSANTPTVLMDWYKPMVSTVVWPRDLVWSADGQKLYISFVGRTIHGQEDLTSTQKTCILDRDGNIYDRSFGKKNTVRRLAVDPIDNQVFYQAAAYNGFDVFNAEGLVRSFVKANFPAPISGNAMPAGINIDFDKNSNLWAILYANAGEHFLIMLPRKGANLYEWDNISSADWKVHPVTLTNNSVFWDSKILFHSTKPFILITTSDTGGGYTLINHNNSFEDFSDDVYYVREGLPDQTGAVETSRVYCAVEDKNGAFWIGTAFGVLVMDDPAAAMSPNYALKRPLVARNDGTNYGDYLLSTDQINSIAVDHTNRKWIGTAESGLYLVSADGSEILEHFTTENSPLPTNTVYAVSVDPLSSAVYVGTDNGLYVYNGTSSPAADSYSEVNVYPNPVRPDYTGWITITGLMDNSLVKIADAAGNVVHSGRSEGGSMVWDGCNAAGERVRSGVYFILASQNQDGNSGVVAKITVIN